jgi:FAD/FMN-containing dehydrogenase
METIDAVTIDKLATEFTGALLRPGDATYDEAREVYNAMFNDRRPALIAQCRNTADVAAGVTFGRDNGLTIAVRGGGHSVAGFSAVDGGLVIDLSPMKHIDVDPDGRVARAQPGVLLGELDAATQEHGLATPLGFISVTGIAGLTLNGGMGFLLRKHGLSCDNLLAAEVVLADGSVVRASDTENADLMWGLRGGGGNFGIVTSFEFRLHEVSEIFLCMRFYDVDALGDLLRGFARTAPTLIDDVVAYAGTLVVPEGEMFPPELHNKLMGMLLVGHIDGDADAAAASFAPLLDAVPAPALEMMMPMPFVMAQTMQDEDMPSGRQNYWKAGNMDTLSDEAIDIFVKHAPTATSPYCQPGFFGLGGAMARVGESDTAYCGRSAAFNFSVDNMWDDPAENDAQIAWSRAFYDEMAPHLSDSLYLNFASEETPERVRRSYGPNYERLVQLKRTYDPANVFHLNQNIQP